MSDEENLNELKTQIKENIAEIKKTLKLTLELKGKLVTSIDTKLLTDEIYGEIINIGHIGRRRRWPEDQKEDYSSKLLVIQDLIYKEIKEIKEKNVAIKNLTYDQMYEKVKQVMGDESYLEVKESELKKVTKELEDILTATIHIIGTESEKETDVVKQKKLLNLLKNLDTLLKDPTFSNYKKFNDSMRDVYWFNPEILDLLGKVSLILGLIFLGIAFSAGFPPAVIPLVVGAVFVVFGATSVYSQHEKLGFFQEMNKTSCALRDKTDLQNLDKNDPFSRKNMLKSKLTGGKSEG